MRPRCSSARPRTTRASAVAQCSPRPCSLGQRERRLGERRPPPSVAVLGVDRREAARGVDHGQVVAGRRRACRPPPRARRSPRPARPLQNRAMPSTGQPTGRQGVAPRSTDRCPAATARVDVAVHVAVDLLQARDARLERRGASAPARRSAASIHSATSSSRPVLTAIHAFVRHRLASPRTASSPSASSQPATVRSGRAGGTRTSAP